MTHNDEHLLEVLSRSLADPDHRPHAERIEAVRARAIAGPAPAPATRHRFRFVLVAAAAVALFAAGMRLGYRPPEPVRDVLDAIGVDIMSAEQEAAEEAVDQVVAAIAEKDPAAFVRANRDAKKKIEKLKETDPESASDPEREREEWEIRAFELWPCLYQPPECAAVTPSPSPSPTASATIPNAVGTPPSS